MAEAPTAIQDMLAALDRLRAAFASAFASAATEVALRDENARFLGKKGELTGLLKGLGKLAPEERKQVGELVNVLKRDIETGFDARLAAIRGAAREADLNAAPFDLTLPPRSAPLGHKHPISLVREEVIQIFERLGFAVFDGPDVDLEDNNFTRLGFPPDHPATDMQDSFWTTRGVLLRTHTSNIQ